MKRAICVLALMVWLLCPRPVSAQDCVWRPWAASWSTLNKGPDLYPPNHIYNPTNWDYSFSQTTFLNTPKTTPDGSAMALHWFLDRQTGFPDPAAGSGGVYQEITVQQGVPLKYSFWWRGATGSTTAWFEFMLIDGPFTPYDADMRPGGTNPYIMRKRENVTFAWEQLTDTSTVAPGPVQSTLTPTQSTVTVVLKAGRSPGGSMEAFFDDVRVWQGQEGPNLVINGTFEDVSAQPACDNQLMYQDAAQSNYWFALTTCPLQHTTVAPVSPPSHDNTSNTTLTITGTNLELVAQVKLVPVAGGPEIIGTFAPPPGPNATSMTVNFTTTGAVDGFYNVVTTQGLSPPCLIQTLHSAFEITCPTSAVIGSVSPAAVTDPPGDVQLTVTGTNLDRITGASLSYGSDDPLIIDAYLLTMNGSDLLLTFDLSCAPAGAYDLVLNRSDVCRGTTAPRAFWVVKSLPAGACDWQPWAAAWTALNLGPDLDPSSNRAFDATNWDYTFSQHPTLGTALDTPDGSALALHWFLGAQDGFPADALGSGGVFQQITVAPHVPLEYSFQWKGNSGTGKSWFEFLLIDGPFNMLDADVFQESASANNPAIIRKRELSASSFGWEQVTHLSDPDVGPAGARPATITPSGTTVTVVLKAGRNPGGSMESLWDNIVVTQAGGPNLIRSGDFEDLGHAGLCDRETVTQIDCELNAWRRSGFQPCNVPFADADGDKDVDQIDFALFQACFTGSGIFVLPAECACFDRPEPIDPDGDIDQSDLFKFEDCASGPGIPAGLTCGG